MPVDRIWRNYRKAGCISKVDFDTYFSGLEFGYAIFLHSVKRFRRAIGADTLRRKFGFVPPQSFIYLPEEYYSLLIMPEFKVLIDTNVFIGLEDAGRVQPKFADLVRKCGQYGVRIFIHAEAKRDIERDRDVARRDVSLSRIRKFDVLAGIPMPARGALEKQFGVIAKANDEVDVALLYAISINSIDFLITQDQGIHSRVRESTLSKRVLTVDDALVWLRQTFEPTQVRLPLIDECKAHEIHLTDEIFDSLREGYSGFDTWWRDKCVKEHRLCWVASIDGELAGIVVRKDESHQEAHKIYRNKDFEGLYIQGEA